MKAKSQSAVKLPRPYTQNSFAKQLGRFSNLIKEVTFQDTELTPEIRRRLISESLRYDQFCAEIRCLFGPTVRTQELKTLYRKITSNPEARIDWSEVFSIFKSRNGGGDGVEEDLNVFEISRKTRIGDAAGNKRRRDILQCIGYMAQKDCYITASQKGVLSVWNSKLHLLSCVDIQEPSWITGCVYLPTLRRLLCSTERSLCLWDSKGNSQNILCLKPVENSPQSIAHVLLLEDESPDEMVLIGDDQGYISIMTLTANDVAMKISKGKNQTTKKSTINTSSLTYPIYRRRFHDDWVIKLKYFPKLRCFGSCSPSSNFSFLLEPIDRITDHAPVNPVAIPKGVNCFDFCAPANIIATGGVDKIIRVWHPHIFTRPTGKLIGHLFTIADICCNERDQQIISLSTARVIRVWDIQTLTSLQIFTDNEKRSGEPRTSCLFYDNMHERLLTGSSVFDMWPLARAVQDTMHVPLTHDRPINIVLYNPGLNQVVSLCSESILKVWEFETGMPVYQIPNAHGSNIEVTSLALDNSGYRLASGAADGSLKVWDVGSGQQCKRRAGNPKCDDVSILSLTYFIRANEKLILALGWNSKIKVVLDSSELNDLPILKEINRSLLDIFRCPSEEAKQMYSESNQYFVPSTPETRISSQYVCQLTCMTLLSPSIVLVGYNQGHVVMWDITNDKAQTILKLPNDNQKNGDNLDHKVNMIKILEHQKKTLDPCYIKKLTMVATKSYKRRLTIDRKDASFDSESALLQTSSESDHLKGDVNADSLSVPSTSRTAEERQSQTMSGLKLLIPSNLREKSGSLRNSLRPERRKMSLMKNGSECELIDPDSQMLISKSEPVIAVVHQDSYIRFWDQKGQLLREIRPMTRRSAIAVTTICHDENCDIMVTGDRKGYLTLWNIGKFLEKPREDDMNTVTQVVRWRAHLSNIVSLEYVNSAKSIISGSADGSVRVWWGNGGRFVGFFGQPRFFRFPVLEETSTTPPLPYDINERPIKTKKSKSREKKRETKKYEYPLIFDNRRWKRVECGKVSPVGERQIRKERENSKKPTEKFFAALMKPRAYNHHLETSISGEWRTDSVFKTLPVYKLTTLQIPKTPDVSMKSLRDDEIVTFHSEMKDLKRNQKMHKKNKLADASVIKHVYPHQSLQKMPKLTTGRTSRLSFPAINT